MAKKKKQTRSRKKAEVVETSSERSALWPITGAVIMCMLALFLLLGSFKSGGNLPISMFNAARAVFGWAAYLTPVALIYWAFYKFTTEDRHIPPKKFIAMLGVLLLSASWFHVGFSANSEVSRGGAVGRLVGGAVLQALDTIPAAVLLFVAMALTVLYTFGLTQHAWAAIRGLFSREDQEDTDLNDLKGREGFRLNKGVPVEGIEQDPEPPARPKPRLASFRNSMARSASEPAPSTDPQKALTIATDTEWQFPNASLFNQKQDKANAGDVNGNAEIIRSTFENFNIEVEMEGANIGPRVTQYTLKPPTGVKLAKITALENNLALDLAATAIRMEAPIPGKRAVGIEVPNIKPATVRVGSLLQASEFSSITSPLGFVIGKDISGKPVVADLAKMPHLLVAGQTGSGKSVMINTILSSLLYRNSPADLKLILVDPKFVELGTYNDIPHLLTPVITEPEKVISALKWAVAEMERRLRAMAEVNTSNIIEYNAAKKEAGMPHIVVVIDELADLMMMAARDVEALIVRLAQKARAAGIHLILATQRPSVNVITGLIKANVPARIAFTVASQVDSRTIIDQMGAEKLLGQGDMLFYTTDMAKPRRVQGALIEKGEVVKLTDFIKEQRAPEYNEEIISQPVQLNGKGGVVADMGGSEGGDDGMWRDAVSVVIESRKASTSLLQRKLRIGYGRAARLIETMEEQGIVSQADGSRPREVLVSSLDELGGAPAGAVEQEEYAA
jgi:S-DNA-T family DNA segregation ATPase FtsK/SpoIIIE